MNYYCIYKENLLKMQNSVNYLESYSTRVRNNDVFIRSNIMMKMKILSLKIARMNVSLKLRVNSDFM